MIDSVIDLQELRIGNLLEYKGELVSVTMLSMDIDDEYNEIIGFVKYGTSSNEHAEWNRALALDLKRIPITPAWMARCGFEKHNNGLFVTNGVFIDYKPPRFVTPFYSDGTSFQRPMGRHIEYIHQLQNIYFCLTGDKLPIKHE
jgi:hypothetical protein